MLLKTLESARSKVLSPVPSSVSLDPPRHSHSTSKTSNEVRIGCVHRNDRNDSKWLHFHLQFCRWPGFISHNLCDLQVAEIHANLQAWDLSVNVTIHFERITKFDFFDESKKGAVLLLERPALVCSLNFDASGQLQGYSQRLKSMLASGRD